MCAKFYKNWLTLVEDNITKTIILVFLWDTVYVHLTGCFAVCALNSDENNKS